MDVLPAQTSMNVQDVYTDVNSLQNIKTEKNSDVALRKVAQQFESIFVGMMLKSMRDANAVFEKDSLFQNNESKFYRDMYDQQLSLSLSTGKGIGIAQALYKQLKGSVGESLSSDVAQDEKTNVLDAPRIVDQTSPLKLRARRGGRPVNNEATHSVGGLEKEAAHVLPDTAVASEKTHFEGKDDFVSHLLPMAKKAAALLGANPLMLVAQAALETGWGKHVIQNDNGSSKNLFNIKANTAWQGEQLTKKTLEYKDGVAVQEHAAFRKYESFEQSFNDFVDFIKSNPRYQNALSVAKDATQFIKQLQVAGYATDPNYAAKVTSVYNHLEESYPQGERHISADLAQLDVLLGNTGGLHGQ